MKIKRWSCPFCSQTSTRHWNLKIHIHRRHNGIGEPIRTAGSFNSNYGAVRRQVESAQAHFAKSDNFRNTPVHAYKTDYYYNNPSFSSMTKERNRASSSQNMDEMMRMIAEYKELLRRSPLRTQSSRSSDMINNIALLLLLAASSNSRKFQNNNVSNKNELPIGYRI